MKRMRSLRYVSRSYREHVSGGLAGRRICRSVGKNQPQGADHRAGGEEHRVSEVQQAGHANDNIQAERQNHIDFDIQQYAHVIVVELIEAWKDRDADQNGKVKARHQRMCPNPFEKRISARLSDGIRHFLIPLFQALVASCWP